MKLALIVITFTLLTSCNTFTKKDDKQSSDESRENEDQNINKTYISPKGVSSGNVLIDNQNRVLKVEETSKEITLEESDEQKIVIPNGKNILSYQIRPNSHGLSTLSYDEKGSLFLELHSKKENESKRFLIDAERYKDLLEAYGSLMFRFEIFEQINEQKFIILASDLDSLRGYVIDTNGKLINEKELFKGNFESKKLLHAEYFRLKENYGKSNVELMIENNIGLYSNDDSKSDENLAIYMELNSSLDIVKKLEIEIDNLGDFDTSNEQLAICNYQNDKDNQNDSLIQIYNLENNKLVKETIYSNLNSDICRAVKFDSNSNLYVGGETGIKFASTGSWSGNSQAFINRYDQELNLLQSNIIGDERRDIVENISLTKDQLIISGTYDATPNNHLPKEEHWDRFFYQIMPMEF